MCDLEKQIVMCALCVQPAYVFLIVFGHSVFSHPDDDEINKTFVWPLELCYRVVSKAK